MPAAPAASSSVELYGSILLMKMSQAQRDVTVFFFLFSLYARTIRFSDEIRTLYSGEGSILLIERKR